MNIEEFEIERRLRLIGQTPMIQQDSILERTAIKHQNKREDYE